jgi:hypothetical protein
MSAGPDPDEPDSASACLAPPAEHATANAGRRFVSRPPPGVGQCFARWSAAKRRSGRPQGKFARSCRALDHGVGGEPHSVEMPIRRTASACADAARAGRDA